MKTSKRTTEQTIALWVWIGSMFMTALCAYMLSPALYVLVIGAFLCLAVIGASFAAAIAVSSDGGILSAYVSMELIKSGFQLAGLIIEGLASACNASSN